MRLIPLLIFLFWIASMAWLTATKLIPPLRTGTAPSYEDVLPAEAVRLPPVLWSIHLNDRPIGVASNEVNRDADGRASVKSRVTINELSLDHLLSQRLGGFSGSLFRSFGPRTAQRESIQTLSFDVESEMSFDHFGQLTGFDCVVDVADLDDCIILRGTVMDDRLQLIAYVTLPSSGDREEASPKPVHKSDIQLPPGSLVADSLSPRPRFGRLRVGQTWTFQSYRPLAPNRPLQLVEATVESRERIQWHGQQVRAFHIVYRRPAGSVLNLDQELGRVWVHPDGTAIRQTMHWGALKLTFERQLDSSTHDPREPRATASRGTKP